MLALDHIVFSGSNAEDASRRYGKRFSIKAIKGGEHKEWGTYNYLAYFSNDTYLEWLGINDLNSAQKSNNPLIKHLVYEMEHNRIGPFQFALRTDQMNKYITHFQAKNIPFHGPFSGQREKPDGEILKWRMLFPDYDHQTEMLPFLIEWESRSQTSSLFNPQAITNVYHGKIDKEKFLYIYQLKPKRILKNQMRLLNAKLQFTNNNELTFKLE